MVDTDVERVVIGADEECTALGDLVVIVVVVVVADVTVPHRLRLGSL